MDGETRETRSGPARGVAVAAALLVAAAGGPEPGAAQEAPGSPVPPAERMTEVVRAVESIDAMRSSLARSFSGDGAEVDRATFRAVCRPVGQRARATAEEHGWRFQQLSRKYRNPAHAPDGEAAEVLRRMEADPDLASIWRRTRLDERPGWRYFRRVVVEPSCLACHGAEEDRPEFVRRDYPEDRAHGFAPGDLRGVYAVFVPAEPEESRP